MTSVPGPTFGPTGFVVPLPSAVLAGVQADWNAAFNNTLNYQFTTPQGQLTSSEAAVVSNVYALFVYYTNQVDPAYASGRMQDAIARIYFLERIPSAPTVLQIACTGGQGVVIPEDSLIQDTSGNIYTCTGAVTIPGGGVVTASFANLIPGPSAVPDADNVSIYQAIAGWDSVTCLSGVVGNNTETRAEFEARRAASVAVNSVGSLPSVKGAVLSVAGVLDAYVTENDTSGPLTIGGVTLVAKSLYVAAVGGTDEDVAHAIWTKKAPGCAYNGNTTVVVQDLNSGYLPPYPSYSVSFERPAGLAILFAVHIVSSPQVPSNAAVLIQNAIISAFAGGDGGARAKIGATLYASRFYSPVLALGSWVQILSLLVGSDNTPSAMFTGHINGTALTVAAVASGSIAVGQTISDQTGAITVGTTIVSGSGLNWVVSTPQTVGATFTGTGSGTNLTASAVTGVISTGDAIVGTGVPANTVIVSQTSGTTGGAGVYVTNNATTSSGNALTANDFITSAVANANTVVVDIDQVPITAAGDIVVTAS